MALSLSRAGSFASENGAEIVTYDASRQLLYVVSGGSVIQAISIADPAMPVIAASLDIADFAPGTVAGANSIAYSVSRDLLAVALASNPVTDNGLVAVAKLSQVQRAINADGSLTAENIVDVVKVFEVGALPDMVTFTPDGNKILVANEAEPDGDIDPDGSISIIDVSGKFDNLDPLTAVSTAGFSAFNGRAADLRADGIRLFPDIGENVARDLEPEYIAISSDGTKAFVTLQENNAIAIVDIESATVTEIKSLGLKDYSLEGNGLDASDRDGNTDNDDESDDRAININLEPVFGLYMPDSIASFEVNGETFYVIANEGDDRGDADDAETPRGDAVRLKDIGNVISFGRNGLSLDDSIDQALLADNELGRLTISSIDGDTDGDGDIDQIVAYGGRSFSVLDSDANLVFDSGDQIARITAELSPELFNADDGLPEEFDTRSDAKGAEPEAITTGVINGTPYAFVGLERAGGGVLAFNLSDPSAPVFEQYIRNDADIAPEGFAFISAADSPTGEALLAVANEVSGTVTINQVTETTSGGNGGMEADFTLSLIHLADQEAGIPALDDAPRASAVINALKDDYENTLVLSSGDAFIPGVFFSASEQVYGGPGRADILIQNELGIQAIAFGNHEFDRGTAVVRDLIAGNDGFAGANFPYLSSNLDFSTDENLADLVVADDQAPQPNSIAATTVIDVNGEKIGVVGATTPTIDFISSPGEVTVLPDDFDGNPTDAQLDALAAEIQADVDELLAANPDINKVVLLAHMQQISIEQSLATRLTNVDIIVAGGSNTRLFDENDAIRPGDTTDQGTYPIFTTDADGNPVAVVNTDGNYKYIGRFVASFDENGLLIEESYNPEVSGAYATDDAGVARLNAENLVDPEVQEIIDNIKDVIIASESNVFGVSEVFLNGSRGSVRIEETNLGNLTADANLAIAKETDDSVVISIKNGGGIRNDIGQTVVPPGSTGEVDRLPTEAIPEANKPVGGISQNDIANALSFNNGLTLLTVTAQELFDIIEYGVGASSPDDGNTQGRFPQVAGIQFSFDLTQEENNRVESLVVLDDAGNDADVIVQDGELVGDPARTFRLVTLDFLAGGGDGYAFPTGESANAVTITAAEEATRTGEATFAPDGSEQDALAEYLADNFGSAENPFTAADTTRDNDTRLQNLAFRSDTVIDGAVIESGFTPSEDGSTVALTDLGGADAVRFDLSDIQIGNASEVRVFVVDGDGIETQVGAFSVLEAGQINASFMPSFSLDVAEGETLRFELVGSDGGITPGTTSIDGNGNAVLTFGDSTLSLVTDDGTGASNLVTDSNDGDGAAALDFTGQTGDSTVRFSVFREAAFDSTVGLYIVDDLTGQVTFNDVTYQVGEDGYAEAALGRSIEGLSLSTDDDGATTIEGIISNDRFGTYISVDNSALDTTETYFSFLGANSDGSDHVKLLGNNAIGFEDLPGLGDADFNDLVVSFEIVPSSVPV